MQNVTMLGQDRSLHHLPLLHYRKFMGLTSRSQGIVLRLSLLFSLDSFAGALVTGTLLAYYFQVRLCWPFCLMCEPFPCSGNARLHISGNQQQLVELPLLLRHSAHSPFVRS